MIYKFPKSYNFFPYRSWPPQPLYFNTESFLWEKNFGGKIHCFCQLRNHMSRNSGVALSGSQTHDFYSETITTLLWLAEQLLDKWPGNGHAGEQIATLQRKSSYTPVSSLNSTNYLIYSPSSQDVLFRMTWMDETEVSPTRILDAKIFKRCHCWIWKLTYSNNC